jgi:hypothetical protein
MSARHEINKANAKHSPGRKTAEDLAAYQLHVASFVYEYRPKGATEAHLVQSLADIAWRLDLADNLEMHESKARKENGFVFTDAEIATHLQTRAKRNLATKPT